MTELAASRLKILIVNYRYFISGGPERYMFNITSALEEQGHEVIHFSINYSRNLQSKYSEYFVQPISSPDSVYFQDHDKSIRTWLKTIERSFYSSEVENAIRKLVQDTKPDVALVQHYLRKLSPAVLVGLKKENVPIVVRISDFLMLCPQSLFLRNGKPCEECLQKHSMLPSLKHRCVKNSLLASLVHYASTKYHQTKGYFSLIDKYIVPSNFTYQKMLQAGFDEKKLVEIPTFASDYFFEPVAETQQSQTPAFLFVGHLEKHKGIRCVLDAFIKVKERYSGDCEFWIAGEGSERAYLENLVDEHDIQSSVKFLGFQDTSAVRSLYSSAYATLVPSIWYENLPNTVIESMACGTPVVGADHGSISSLIETNETGMLASPGDVDAWFTVMLRILENPEAIRVMGIKAREYAEEHFSKKSHTDMLQKVFLNVIQNHITNAHE